MSKKLKKGIGFFFILLSSATLIGYFFDGKELFSSFLQYIKVTSFGFFIALFLACGNTIIGNKTGKVLNWRVNAEKANTITMLITLVYGVFISISIPYLYYQYVFNIPREYIWRHVSAVSFFSLMINFFFVSIFYSKHLAKYWMQSIRNEEKLQRENLLAQYEALKNQVNPHFLFNSLNTLTGLVEKNATLATQYIKKLSDIYRHVLEQKGKEIIDIREEIAFLEDYIFLQKLRYGEGLQYHVTKDLKGFVAPLAIQMLVENAIKHNVVEDDRPLRINILRDENYIVIKNNLQKKKSIERYYNPLGLENLISRYKHIHEKEVEVLQTEREFIVKLPILETPKL